MTLDDTESTSRHMGEKASQFTPGGLVISNMNSPVTEYFLHPAVGVSDDNTTFNQLFEGEPRASKSDITLSSAPRLGVTLNDPNVNAWRLNL
jgi:hypothetical protein